MSRRLDKTTRAPRPDGNGRIVRAAYRGKLKGVGEPSAATVTAALGGLLVVVSDLARAINLYQADGSRPVEVIPLEMPEGPSSFEAIDFGLDHFILGREHDKDGSSIWFSTRDGTVVGGIDLDLPADEEGVTHHNKGLEGHCFLHGNDLLFHGAPCILGVKEGRPKAFFALDARQALAAARASGDSRAKVQPQIIAHDEQLDRIMTDFADIEYDAATDRYYVCSDECSTAAELRLIEKDGAPYFELVRWTEARIPDTKVIDKLKTWSWKELGLKHFKPVRRFESIFRVGREVLVVHENSKKKWSLGDPSTWEPRARLERRSEKELPRPLK